MKILVGLNTKNISSYLDYTNSFIIGLKEYSINYLEYSMEEIKKLRDDYKDIEIFISINKNIFNSDLNNLENILLELDKLNINGILFYDLAILYLKDKLNLHTPLVWAQEHLTTNYNTMNYYYNKGVNYALTSSEITYNEIIEISKNSDIKLLTNLFGYPDVSFSKRKLLTNYFLYNKKEKDKEYYEIKSNDIKYIVKENKLGTRIVSGNILNGLIYLDELKDSIDYAILNEDMINHNDFIKVLSIYKDVIDKKIEIDKGNSEINKMFKNIDTGFFNKKTIYKVKQ